MLLRQISHYYIYEIDSTSLYIQTKQDFSSMLYVIKKGLLTVKKVQSKKVYY